MEIVGEYESRQPALVALFEEAFSASDGPEEGAAVGAFVARLLGETPIEDLRVFTALDDGRPVGCICFSRLDYPEDPRRVMLLSPVAVATAAQGRGVGQALIRHGLEALRAEGVDVAITYGDPAFYGKVGFHPITEAEARPPMPLSQPEGWIGQALTGAELAPLRGPSHCVTALNDPGLW
jgi:predicted N-acetyltransferase YhbS